MSSINDIINGVINRKTGKDYIDSCEFAKFTLVYKGSDSVYYGERRI